MIIYEGRNHSGTGDIAVIATGIDRPSANPKTGDMIQIWILNADVPPVEAQRNGEDAAVCGDCPLRPTNGGGCYVQVGQAPTAIWNKYKAGGYNHWCWLKRFEKPVRIGAYGDVAEIPKDIVIRMVLRFKAGYTCYTHQWRTRPDLQDIAMASVETVDEYHEARAMEWSTFRIAPPGGLVEPGEVMCLNVRRDTQCRDCKLCKGNAPMFIGIVIPAHGATAKRVHAQRKEKV